MAYDDCTDILLKNLVKDHMVFLDTCSLMHWRSLVFLTQLTPCLRMYEKKVIIPFRCIEELRKHKENKMNKLDPEVQERTGKVLIQLKKLKEEGLLDIRGEEHDNFADNVFLTVFSRYSEQYPLLLITQDFGLSHDILKLNESELVVRHPVVVKKIGKYGKLVAVPEKNKEVRK